MSSPILTRWIVEHNLPSSGGIDEIRAHICGLAKQKLHPRDAATIKVVDCLAVPESADGAGRQKVLFLLEGDELAASALRSFVKGISLNAQPDWALLFEDEDEPSDQFCSPMSRPENISRDLDVNVAIIGNQLVRQGVVGQKNLSCFDVSSIVTEVLAPLSAESHSSDMASVMASDDGTAKGAHVWSYSLATPSSTWQMLLALHHVHEQTTVRVVCVSTKAIDKDPGDDVEENVLLSGFIETMSTCKSHPTVFVASGANPPDGMSFPALAPHAIVAGAIGLFEDSPSPHPLGRSRAENVFVRGRAFGGASGTCVLWTTSFAAPYLAGCIAHWLTIARDLSHSEIVEILETTSDKSDPTLPGIFNGVRALEKVRELAKLRAAGQPSLSVPKMAQSVQSAE